MTPLSELDASDESKQKPKQKKTDFVSSKLPPNCLVANRHLAIAMKTEAPLAASAVSVAVGECGGLRRISAAFLLDERLTPP